MRHLNAAEHLSSLFLALGSLASCARSARRPFTHRRDLPWCLHPLTTVPLLHQLILPIQFTHHRALLVNSFTPFSFTPHVTSPRLIHPSLSTQLLLVLIRGSFFHFHSLINHNLFRIAYSHSIYFFSYNIFPLVYRGTFLPRHNVPGSTSLQWHHPNAAENRKINPYRIHTYSLHLSTSRWDS